MRRALLHSGGNARGAVGVPVLEGLIERHGVEGYAAAAGVSVGMVNVPEALAGRLPQLRELYQAVDGVTWYLRPRAPWNWGGGVTSIDRLRKRIGKVGASVHDLPNIPVYAGIYDYQDDVYRSIDARFVKGSDGRSRADRWLDARVASMAIPVVMSGWDVQVDARRPEVLHRCYDGGMRHVIPELPMWRTFDAIDVIVCSPLERADRRGAKDVNGFWEVVGRSVDIWTDGVVQRDIERLQRWASAGVEVNVYAPRDSGRSFDASPDAMRRRLEEGEWMWNNPVRLG